MRVLLRKVEGASVALVTDDYSNTAELLPTRYDLFQYRGGVSWGYKGAGVQNLSYAIAARMAEEVSFLSVDIHAAAKALVDNVLSSLDGDAEHDLSGAVLLKALPSGSWTQF